MRVRMTILSTLSFVAVVAAAGLLAGGALGQNTPRDVRSDPLARQSVPATAPSAEVIEIDTGAEVSTGGSPIDETVLDVSSSDGIPVGTAPADSLTRVAHAALPAAGRPEPVTVLVDHAKVVRLPENTQTVIVGNPIIADVTVQRNGILVVTGKSYGTTNLIALDAAGMLLAESMISVQAPSDAVVTVQRGLLRESYSCTPTCQPALRLGDSPEHFGGVGNQATQRNTLATQR